MNKNKWLRKQVLWVYESKDKYKEIHVMNKNNEEFSVYFCVKTALDLKTKLCTGLTCK